MRLVAFIAAVLLFISPIEAKKNTKQCKGMNGKSYEIGQGYETKCQKFICRWIKSRRNVKMVQKSSENCCKYQGKKYTIGEVVTSKQISKCSQKVVKCESLGEKETLLLAIIQEHCCIYEGKTLAPGERIAVSSNCAFIACTNDTRLSFEVQYPGAQCCLKEDGSMHPQMAEIEMKHNGSEKIFSCCKGSWIYFQASGNNSGDMKQHGDVQQHCDSSFDPFSLPDSPNKTRHLSVYTEGQNWMQAVDGTKRIHELSIPGTHNTMAWRSDFFVNSFVNNQHLTLSDQLKIGVRYLDLRLKLRDKYSSGRWLGNYHGKYYLRSSFFFGVLAELTRFLKENPSEMVIFRYRNEGSRSDENIFCETFNRFIKKAGRYIYGGGNGGFKFLSQTPRLEETRGKILIINDKHHMNCFGYDFDKVQLDNYNGKVRNSLTGRPGAPVVSVGGRKLREGKVNFIEMEMTQEDSDEVFMITSLDEVMANNQTILENLPLKKKYTNQTVDDEDDGLDLSDIPSLDKIYQFKANQTSIIDAGQENNRIFGFIIGLIVAAVVTYAVINAIYKPSEAYKKELEFFLDTVRLHHSFKDKLMKTYASAYDWKCSPKCVASHVNGRMYQYFKNNPKGRVGIVAFDYISNWNKYLPKIIYSRNYRDSPPKYLYVGSNGNARYYQSSRLGKYTLKGFSRNNFPVWKKDGQNQYIFVTDYGYWGIGPEPLEGNSRGLSNIHRPTPAGPFMNHGWLYYTKNGWRSDNTLTVEAVMEGTFLCAVVYEHGNFQGRFLNLYASIYASMWGEIYNLVPLGWNDKISSIKIYGRHLTGYQHTHFGGFWTKFYKNGHSPSMQNGQDDWFSSLRCLY